MVKYLGWEPLIVVGGGGSSGKDYDLTFFSRQQGTFFLSPASRSLLKIISYHPKPEVLLHERHHYILKRQGTLA